MLNGANQAIKDDVYEDTTVSELLYKFNKGIKGVRITLAENPRFYLDLSHPYNAPDLLGIKQTMFDPPGAVPRKIPEQNLSNFFRNENKPIMIHVYVDQRPFISLEDPSASWGFSLAKWDRDRIPGGILRGNVHRSIFEVTSRLMIHKIDREGALYDGIHLKRLIPYNISNEDTLKNMMKNWLSLRPTATSAPLPLHGFWSLDLWQQVPPGEEFDRWFQIVLEHLIDNARHFGLGSTPVVTMPKPELPQISEPVPHLTAGESSGFAGSYLLG
ncbi:hypothetical protein FRC08_007278 [Ceratobasidium sp. 394]|nr:hypothetical protein FRC08_007278 [Ceratobasidium sp. 394]